MALKHNELLFMPASIVVNNDDENEDDNDYDDDDEDECEEHKDMEENIDGLGRELEGGLLHKTSRRITID